MASYFLQIICINAYGNHSSTHYNPVYYFFRSIHFFTFLSKKGCAKFCASPMLLDFFRLAAYNQIRSNQGYLPIRWLSFQKCFIFEEQISGKGYPLLTVGNSLFSTCGGCLCKITPQKQQVKVSTLPLYSLALPPFRFQKGQPPDYPYHVLI